MMGEYERGRRISDELSVSKKIEEIGERDEKTRDCEKK